MGLFEKLFPKHTGYFADQGYWKTLTAYTPVFTTRSGSAYESELVRAAIDSRSRHIGKLNIVVQGSAKQSLATKLIDAPNDFQTWYKFLYRLNTILDMQNTAFIVPVFDEAGRTSGIYPILPSSAVLVEYKNEPWVRYRFNNGQIGAVELKLCGILTKFQYSDDIFGGSTTALNDTLDLINLQKQGFSEAIKNGATYRFMARFNNFSKDSDLEKEKKRFNNLNFKSEDGGGLLLFPHTYEDIKQINSSAYTVDSAQMSLIQTNIFNYYGVNESVIQNKALGDELDAFFNGAIEPFAIHASEVITNMLFTASERLAGNRILLSADRLQYMSTDKKVSMVQQLGDRGMISIDEARALFNYPPLPDGKGAHFPIRGEYYMVGERKEGTEDAIEE